MKNIIEIMFLIVLQSNFKQLNAKLLGNAMFFSYKKYCFLRKKKYVEKLNFKFLKIKNILKKPIFKFEGKIYYELKI